MKRLIALVLLLAGCATTGPQPEYAIGDCIASPNNRVPAGVTFVVKVADVGTKYYTVETSVNGRPFDLFPGLFADAEKATDKVECPEAANTEASPEKMLEE